MNARELDEVLSEEVEQPKPTIFQRIIDCLTDFFRLRRLLWL